MALKSTARSYFYRGAVLRVPICSVKRGCSRSVPRLACHDRVIQARLFYKRTTRLHALPPPTLKTVHGALVTSPGTSGRRSVCVCVLYCLKNFHCTRLTIRGSHTLGPRPPPSPLVLDALVSVASPLRRLICALPAPSRRNRLNLSPEAIIQHSDPVSNTQTLETGTQTLLRPSLHSRGVMPCGNSWGVDSHAPASNHRQQHHHQRHRPPVLPTRTPSRQEIPPAARKTFKKCNKKSHARNLSAFAPSTGRENSRGVCGTSERVPGGSEDALPELPPATPLRVGNAARSLPRLPGCYSALPRALLFLRFLVFSFVTDDSSSKSCRREGCPDRRITTSRRTHENNTLRRLPLAPSSSCPPRVQAAAAA